MLKLSWQHLVLNTRCSWLHGDPRGFRSRGHRMHSSGDYKNPPPRGEHVALWQYHQARSAKAVEFEVAVRIRIVCEFVTKMLAMSFRIIACSCGREHLHALAEAPSNYGELRRVIGKCKLRASHAVRDELPGGIWAAGFAPEKIRDLGHLRNAYNYIRTKQEPGTVVWSHRPDEDWIGHPEVGVVLMQRARNAIRVFGVPQTPASEVLRRAGSDGK